MTQLIHTQDSGSRVNFTATPPQQTIDALIRHGYRYDERAKQWWSRGQGGSVQTADQLHAWLETQPVPACDADTHRFRFQSYYTPQNVADRLAYLADITEGMACLEPSAGYGAIASIMSVEGGKVTCLEADPLAVEHLRRHYPQLDTQQADFLTAQPEDTEGFDRIVMNPPFSRDQDCRHVCHAFKFLKPGGKLVAVVGSYAVSGRGSSARDALRSLVSRHGRVVEDLPAGTFENAARSVIIELNN